MPEESDLKTTALTTTTDFYTLLSLLPTASTSEIRTAYRRTALKYHPDKLSALPPSEKDQALEKFHLLQVANDVLLDESVRELYDNARRAREAKKEREGLLEGRRREMVRELERREGDAIGKKRKRDDGSGGGGEEVEFERELRRLAKDGRRRRVEREEALRREMEVIEREEREAAEGRENGVGVGSNGSTTAAANGTEAGVPELDRSITLRYPQNERTAHFDKDALLSQFSRFGEIEDIVLRDKKIKVPGMKHRVQYTVAVIVYKSVVGAHAAVTDFPVLVESDPESWKDFEEVGWAGGKEPDYIPKSTSSAPRNDDDVNPRTRFDLDDIGKAPTQPNGNGAEASEKKAPSFASFKAGPATTPKTASGNGDRPSLDEVTMMRLKNAEKKRREAAAAKSREDAG